MEVVSLVSHSTFPWVSLSLGTRNPLSYSISMDLSVLDSTCGWGKASALQCPAYFPWHNILKIDACCCEGHHFFLRVDQFPLCTPHLPRTLRLSPWWGTMNNGMWMSVAQIDSISLHQQNHWMPLLSRSLFLVFEGSPHRFHNNKVIYILLLLNTLSLTLAKPCHSVDNYEDSCGVIQPCDFSLQFPRDCLCRSCFHLATDHVCTPLKISM